VIFKRRFRIEDRRAQGARSRIEHAVERHPAGAQEAEPRRANGDAKAPLRRVVLRAHLRAKQDGRARRARGHEQRPESCRIGDSIARALDESEAREFERKPAADAPRAVAVIPGGKRKNAALEI